MGEWTAIDSRDYIVAFEFRSIDACPPDFELPPSIAGFDIGLFLPRGDRDWFGRPLYPPCVLLLKDGTLHIVAHPSTKEPPRQCALDQIDSVESGNMLLKGWLRFVGSGFDYNVRYNTRGFPAVFRFIRCLQEKLLPGAQPGARSGTNFGPDPDIKFGNALSLELDTGEAVRMQVFQPPRDVKSRSWLLPRHRWMAGDLLALTGTRLLWITDRERGSYSRYGSVASYAPLGAVRNIGLTWGREGHVLQVDLKSGSAWRIPIAAESRRNFERVGEKFAAALEIQKGRSGTGYTEVHR